MSNKHEVFSQGSIPKMMTKLCIPAVISCLVVAVYNLADIYFIGKTNDPIQVSALSLVGPFFTIISGIGVLIGAGGCAAIAVSLGKGDDRSVKSFSSFCGYITIVFGAILSVILFAGMNTFLDVFGIFGEAREYAREYLYVLGFGMPFIIFANSFGNIVRAEGATKESLLGNMVGSIINILLDPLFIIVFKMGVSGAALATVIGNVVSCAFFIIYIIRRKTSLSINPKYFTLKKEISIKVLSLGLPSALSTFIMSISSIVRNSIIIGYGNEAVASFSVSGTAMMIIGMLQMGITMGIQPAISFNYGANNIKRIKKIVMCTALTTVVIGTILMIIILFYRSSFISAFIKDLSIIEQGSEIMIASLISAPIIGIFNLCTVILQGTEKAISATFVSVLRQGLLYIPLLFIMNRLFALKGTVYSQALADYISVIIATIICLYYYKKQLSHDLVTNNGIHNERKEENENYQSQ